MHAASIAATDVVVLVWCWWWLWWCGCYVVVVIVLDAVVVCCWCGVACGYMLAAVFVVWVTLSLLGGSSFAFVSDGPGGAC